MSFRMNLLGGFSVAGLEGPLSGRVTQRRQITLLALLATAPAASHRRDKIVAWLWRESSEERGRHSLSDTLYVLHEELGEDAIEVHGDELFLNPSVVTVDLWDFRAALESGDLDRAVELYGGPLLDGVHLEVSGEFEHWIADERARLAQQVGEAALERAEELRSEEDLVGAERTARRALTIDPLDEAALRCLIRILDERGDRSGAVRAYETFAGRLASELEVEPAPETEALVARVRARGGADGGKRGVEQPAVPGISLTPVGEKPGPVTGARYRRWLFQTLLWRGRVAEAVRIAEDRALDQGRATLLYVARAAGYPIAERALAAALESAPESAERLSETPALFERGAYAAERGDGPEHALAVRQLRALIPRLEAESEMDARRVRGLVEALEGYAVWRRDDREEALRHLRAGQSLTFVLDGPSNLLMLDRNAAIRWWLADLLSEMGRDREALVVYECLSIAGQEPMANLRVARLRDRLGDGEGARRAYELVATAWQDPDPELEALAAEARREASRTG